MREPEPKAGPNWSLVLTEPARPARTMAIDDALLRCAIEGASALPVLRIYRWATPALSVGANTDLPDGVASRCRLGGVALVRRPTGGGAVLHRDDLTYSVVMPARGMGVLQIYRSIAAGLIEGLSTLGVKTRVVEHNRPARSLGCFASANGADLVVGRRKICGSAQVRRRGYVLQHGSIPVRDLREESRALLGTASPGESTCLLEVCPGARWDDLAAALVRGFERCWGSPPNPRSLTPDETRLAAKLEAGYARILPNSLVMA